MPVFESICADQHVTEWYAHTRDQRDPDCNQCGGATRRLISRFAAIWTKGLSDYGDKNRETFYKDQKAGGHWVARKRSGGGTEDKPIREFIQTPQQQAAYCRDEKLYNPSELGQMEIHSDGQSCSNRGLPGSW